MAGPEALSVQGESLATTTGATAAAAGARAASQRWPQLIPIAQLVAVILGVLAIIWNQQQTTDSLRTDLRTEISHVETGLSTEINRVETRLSAEISELRAEVSENGQRLARIEGSLGIGIPDTAPE